MMRRQNFEDVLALLTLGEFPDVVGVSHITRSVLSGCGTPRLKLYFVVVRLDNVVHDESCLIDGKIKNYPLFFLG